MIWLLEIDGVPVADVDVAAEPACPGAGKCHGPLTWCSSCGDVAFACDWPSCDAHAVECLDWEICRWQGHVSQVATKPGEVPKCRDCGEGLRLIMRDQPWERA